MAECSRRNAPVRVHLKQAVLCVQPSVEEQRIVQVEREDMRNAVRLANDHPRLLHAGELRHLANRKILRGQRDGTQNKGEAEGPMHRSLLTLQAYIDIECNPQGAAMRSHVVPIVFLALIAVPMFGQSNDVAVWIGRSRLGTTNSSGASVHFHPGDSFRAAWNHFLTHQLSTEPRASAVPPQR